MAEQGRLRVMRASDVEAKPFLPSDPVKCRCGRDMILIHPPRPNSGTTVPAARLRRGWTLRSRQGS